MKMNFSEQEIVSMIDFALKNKGAPAQIANECEIQSFSKNGRWYQIDVLTGLESELLGFANQETQESQEDDGASIDGGSLQVCEYPGCENTYVWKDPRQKYCADPECKKTRQKAALERSRQARLRKQEAGHE